MIETQSENIDNKEVEISDQVNSPEDSSIEDQIDNEEEQSTKEEDNK